MADRPIILIGTQCSGCGACAEVRPELFGLDEDGERAVVKVQAAPEEAVREAQSWCPCACIEMGEEPESGPGS